MSEDIRARLRAFIVDNYLFGEDTRFADDESFTASGIVDSTGVLELVAFLEESFAISVQDEELLPENLDSLDRVLGYLARKGVAGAVPLAA